MKRQRYVLRFQFKPNKEKQEYVANKLLLLFLFRVKTANNFIETDRVLIENDTEIQLQKLRLKNKNILEAQIQDGDTLQAIALRYDCSVSTFIRCK